MLSLLSLLVAACGAEGDDIDQGQANVVTEPMAADAAVTQTPDAEAPDAGSADAGPSGLPCDVEEVLATHCQHCHQPGAKNGVSLLTRDALLGMSAKDATMRIVDRSLLRMAATDRPMPPVGKGETVPETDRAVIENWVKQGAPAGVCEH